MFDYADGRKERVYANDANVKSTYVRLFGLPPEIGNVDIELALSKFGNVQQVVREKYSIDTGYPIWNGNRGVHMELTSQISFAELKVTTNYTFPPFRIRPAGIGMIQHL